MLLLEEIVQQEKDRIKNMIKRYEAELESLPHGSLVYKIINGREYGYLQYRDGKKIVSKYIGNSKEKINDISDRIARRRQIEQMLKILKAEYTLAQKYAEVSM